LCIAALSNASFAQCSMCRAGVASNLKDHTSSIGAGLNNGILYLMCIPYIIGGIAVLVWFKKKKEIKAFLNSNN
jgi:hypothetical protein